MDDSDARKGKAKEKEMNEQKIQKAMARVDGEYRDELPDIQLLRGEWVQKCDYGRKLHPIPAYTTSHDAVQRVIDGLEYNTHDLDSEYARYWEHLRTIVGFVFNMPKATPLQKCEAILKALGKWTKEMEG